MFFSTKYFGKLLYYTVRWDHTAAPNSNELTVQKGEEVIIISRPKEDDEAGWYKVKYYIE